MLNDPDTPSPDEIDAMIRRTAEVRALEFNHGFLPIQARAAPCGCLVYPRGTRRLCAGHQATWRSPEKGGAA